MRIESIHSVGLPSQNARAVGFVRRLEDGTFKGASADKLREKFAHRLTAANDNTSDVTGAADSAQAPETGAMDAAGIGQIIDVLA